MRVKGIILAGGQATRLFPATEALSKQLLPVYDKPMIYYALTTLMDAGIRDVMLITNPEHLQHYNKLLQGGEPWGMRIDVVPQQKPKGLADAILIGANTCFTQDADKTVLLLGDNIFHGTSFSLMLSQMLASPTTGATVFLSKVRDPERYGVAVVDDGRVSQIIEKPAEFISPWAVTGLYVYDQTVVEKARSLKPSKRKELEITDLNNLYLRDCSLQHCLLSRDTAWMDCGTPSSLLEASQYVQAIQNRSAVLVGSPDEAAYRNEWISFDSVLRRFRERQDEYAQRVKEWVLEAGEHASRLAGYKLETTEFEPAAYLTIESEPLQAHCPRCENPLAMTEAQLQAVPGARCPHCNMGGIQHYNEDPCLCPSCGKDISMTEKNSFKRAGPGRHS